MKPFLTKVKNLSQKAAELKAAMEKLPPKVAEVREGIASTTAQLQQLKSEIQFNVAGLKADNEHHLSESLQEINASTEVFEKVGFLLTGVDLEISPIQRFLVHLERVDDVHPSVFRSLISSNQHRRATHAILSSLLQAKQMAETLRLEQLDYREVVVGVGPVPTVRLCFREIVQAPIASQSAPKIAVEPQPAAAAASSSLLGQGSFFQERTVPKPSATPVPTVVTTTAPEVSPAKPSVAVAEPAAEASPKEDPLARFKKMPDFSKYKR